MQFLDRNGHANNFLNIIGRDVPFKYVIACSCMIPKKQIRPESVHGNTVIQGQTRGWCLAISKNVHKSEAFLLFGANSSDDVTAPLYTNFQCWIVRKVCGGGQNWIHDCKFLVKPYILRYYLLSCSQYRQSCLFVIWWAPRGPKHILYENQLYWRDEPLIIFLKTHHLLKSM